MEPFSQLTADGIARPAHPARRAFYLIGNSRGIFYKIKKAVQIRAKTFGEIPVFPRRSNARTGARGIFTAHILGYGRLTNFLIDFALLRQALPKSPST